MGKRKAEQEAEQEQELAELVMSMEEDEDEDFVVDAAEESESSSLVESGSDHEVPYEPEGA